MRTMRSDWTTSTDPLTLMNPVMEETMTRRLMEMKKMTTSYQVTTEREEGRRMSRLPRGKKSANQARSKKALSLRTKQSHYL
ncbi:hypothetical protein GBAR_LOCUS27836 [Geodia barretti]|uniref:Uncharacterized protein n=1 Tax=Geodia barretti TaxID=519541 RepID=A0AA35TNA1_GEOBA|nr:hypothetical protein GBAR_LOCUS27836 [Geodia barretti]